MTTSWNKVAKTETTYTKVDKFTAPHLLLENSCALLLENNGYITIMDSLSNLFSKVAKAVTTWGKVERT